MGENTKIQWCEPEDKRRYSQLCQAAARTGLSVNQWKLRRESGMNWCIRCRGWKPASEFHSDRSRISRLQQYCKECCRIRHVAWRYRITHEDAAKILSEDLCPICGRTGAIMEVDHCHVSGKIRGLLCSRCNGALGQFCDSVEILKKAIKYLEERNGKNNHCVGRLHF